MIDIRRIEAEVERLLSQEAAELVDLRYLRENGRWVLRVFVDKHGGVTLEDCEYLSKRIGALLDGSEAVPHAYVLEVSSPGLDRVLKKEKDFERFSGHRARLTLRAPLAGRRNFAGYLRGLDAGQVVLEAGEQTLRLALADIEEARLDPEIRIGRGV